MFVELILVVILNVTVFAFAQCAPKGSKKGVEGKVMKMPGEAKPQSDGAIVVETAVPKRDVYSDPPRDSNYLLKTPIEEQSVYLDNFLRNKIKTAVASKVGAPKASLTAKAKTFGTKPKPRDVAPLVSEDGHYTYLKSIDVEMLGEMGHRYPHSQKVQTSFVKVPIIHMNHNFLAAARANEYEVPATSTDSNLNVGGQSETNIQQPKF